MHKRDNFETPEYVRLQPTPWNPSMLGRRSCLGDIDSIILFYPLFPPLRISRTVYA
jgi:hypothetical protein